MALFSSGSALSFAAPVASTATRHAKHGLSMQTKEALANELNPAIGYFDPLGLADADFWSQGNDATWGFLRQAEIKHGRVAMMAFCGYIVQANGVHFPEFFGPLTTGATPEEQWFNLSLEARGQIIAFIGFLEFWGEFGGKHYMRGGRPGEYPKFENIPAQWWLDLYDPFGIAAKKLAREEGQGSACRDQQRPPRTDRHYGLHGRGEGTRLRAVPHGSRAAL